TPFVRVRAAFFRRDWSAGILRRPDLHDHRPAVAWRIHRCHLRADCSRDRRDREGVPEFGRDQFARDQFLRDEHHHVFRYADGGPGPGVKLQPGVWREPPGGPRAAARTDTWEEARDGRGPASTRATAGTHRDGR